MASIPYGEIQTIDCTAKDEDGRDVTIAQIHYAFIIPCQECRYFHALDGTCHSWHWHNWEEAPDAEPDGFCAWGERRQS